MKTILTLFLAAGLVFAVSAQSKATKGPRYKNAHPSEKYDGKQTVWVSENPGEMKGPEAKNYDHKNTTYKNDESGPVVASLEPRTLGEDENKKVYVPLELEEAKGKNAKGLKGPEYKNYKPAKD